jgi:hypothetical protein
MDILDTFKLPDSFSIQRDYVVRAPPHLSPRISARSAFFTVNSNPNISFHLSPGYQKFGSDYEKIIIPQNKKLTILSDLNRYGINAAALFPGLDGIGKKLKFELDNIKRDLK